MKTLASLFTSEDYQTALGLLVLVGYVSGLVWLGYKSIIYLTSVSGL